MNREQALKVLVELLNRLHLNPAEAFAANEAFKFLEQATAPKDAPKTE